jgi:hypothetical protein
MFVGTAVKSTREVGSEVGGEMSRAGAVLASCNYHRSRQCTRSPFSQRRCEDDDDDDDDDDEEEEVIVLRIAERPVPMRS